MNGALATGDRMQRGLDRPQLPRRPAGTLHAQAGGRARAIRRRCGLRGRRHQGDRRRAGRRHHHAGEPAGAAAAAGLQADPAAGVRRAVPGQLRGLREVPRRAREAAPERLGAALRAGSLRSARLRLPLRVPGPAAHGHRAGAARARVRADPGHQRTDGGVRGGAHATAPIEYVDNPAKLPPADEIERDPRADHPRQHPGAARLRRRGAEALQRQARHAEEDAVPRHARCRCSTSCRWRRWCWTSSTA